MLLFEQVGVYYKYLLYDSNKTFRNIILQYECVFNVITLDALYKNCNVFSYS